MTVSYSDAARERAARAAYRTVYHFPQWDELRPDDQDDWRAVVDAVAIELSTQEADEKAKEVMTRVEIDPNVRVRRNWTFVGTEDVDGPIEVGQVVEVFESESGVVGVGQIQEIDAERRIVYLSVEWRSLATPGDPDG